jgi:hypothetical protein
LIAILPSLTTVLFTSSKCIAKCFNFYSDIPAFGTIGGKCFSLSCYIFNVG